MAKHTAKFDFFGDEYSVQWDGNVWVSPCNGAQWSTIGEAVRSELDHAIRAGGDDPEDLEDAIQAAIDEALEIGSYDLYDSDTAERLDAADLGITDAEYADAIRESLACDQAEGHIYVGQWRVYAA